MKLLQNLLAEEDYMQHNMNQKLGKNPLSRQTNADKAKQQTKPGQAQTEEPTQAPQQGAQSDMSGMGGMDGSDDTQSANDTAKQAVKLLRQSAQVLAPQKFDGDTAKAMTYILGRIQDYFDSKPF